MLRNSVENTPQSDCPRRPSEIRLPFRSAMDFRLQLKVAKNLPWPHHASPYNSLNGIFTGAGKNCFMSPWPPKKAVWISVSSVENSEVFHLALFCAISRMLYM